MQALCPYGALESFTFQKFSSVETLFMDQPALWYRWVKLDFEVEKKVDNRD